MEGNNAKTQYENPLVSRYGSNEMNRIFSPEFKFRTWRRLWVCLAEAQKKVGLPITDEQLKEMRANLDNIDYDLAKGKEKLLRHDVMAHVHTFADACPKAAGIIHLGATSAYVGDNTDLVQTREGFLLLRSKIVRVLNELRDFAERYKGVPTVAYTHFQAAQLTTIGKRACMWMQELLLDLHELNRVLKELPFRGIKGATGTLASFKKLFGDDFKKVQEVDRMIRKQFGFSKTIKITGQTYTRKIDSVALGLLSRITESASKFAVDLRLLQHKGEVEEPFLNKQIGSSAMAYKRNPMQAERIGSLARFVMALSNSTSYTASTQWFERTLDDSANKRLAIPQSFLATDAVLDLYTNIASGMKVHSSKVKQHVNEQMPFVITENLMMEGSLKKDGNRQDLHEVIRRLSMKAVSEIRKGKRNPLAQLLRNEKSFGLSLKQIQSMQRPEEHIGFSVELVEDFLRNEVDPVLNRFRAHEGEVKLTV